jgi:sulfur-oxidizing protein SoxB
MLLHAVPALRSKHPQFATNCFRQSVKRGGFQFLKSALFCITAHPITGINDMISRRDFLQATVAAGAIYGAANASGWSAFAATQAMKESDLLQFEDFGNVTLVHITDIHAQAMPVYFREPSINLGVGDVNGLPPHVTGADFLKMFNLKPGSPHAYALSATDFAVLAKEYGKMGGLDRVASVIKSIRSSREDKMLLLDGGDTWQGSYVSNKTLGADMVQIMNQLKPDAMTAHWEFTYGEDRVKEITETLPFPLLGSNIFDKEWEEPAYEHTKMFERGGVKIAVIGQAFPYLPIANPGWMFPSLSFGIREETLQANVDAARKDGAQLVILLSHNGFDVDRKLASRLKGVDVILTGHTHDAIPEPVKVDETMLIASGSNGKFVSRLDLDVQGGKVNGFRYKLIPIFADVITPDKEMTAVIDETRKPFEKELNEVLGTTDSLLYRRGNFNGTFDDLICQALIEEREADIALSPGFRWGPSLLPGQDITTEDLFNATAMTYPAAYRSEMSGKLIKDILEDVGDNLFNPDPYYQQGGDMVRVGGMGYTMDLSKPIGSRFSDMTLLKTGEKIDPGKNYVVSGWASVNEATEGPPIWDVVSTYIKRVKTVRLDENKSVQVKGA